MSVVVHEEVNGDLTEAGIYTITYRATYDPPGDGDPIISIATRIIHIVALPTINLNGETDWTVKSTSTNKNYNSLQGKFLISSGYTNKNKLFCSGGSAGGLLIGAVINMEPDLWRAAIASVPFVDVVTTMLDPSIPVSYTHLTLPTKA